MIVDAADTLDRGGAKLEFGWKKDTGVHGIEGVVGFAPLEHLELEVSLERNRHHETDPVTRHAGSGFGLKWVPLKE